MDIKMIAKANKKIDMKERLSNILIKFMMTDHANELISKIGYMPLKELMTHYKAPNLTRAGTSERQMNMLLHAVKKANKEHLLRFNKIIDYTNLDNKENAYDAARKLFVEKYQKNKTPIRLLPYDQKLLNMRDQWRVKMKDGKPVTEMEKGKILYDIATNRPIYKFTPKPKLGLAYKLHAYEEHKMAKYDKRMAIQMELDKKSDLFPDQITHKYKMLRESHLEQLRRDLSNLYYPGNITVVVQNKDTEDIKKISVDTKMRLGIVRPYKLTRGRTREQFMAISKAALKDNNNSRVTCIHVDYTKCGPSVGKVIISSLYGLAA